MALPNQTLSAPIFSGEFCHKVEGKNRITIPAEWRFSEETTLFMIPRVTKSCIAVMLQAEVDRLKVVANGYSPEDRSHFLDVLGSQMRVVTLDKGGRITIPEDLFGLLGLPEARQVWLTGAVDNFNVWSIADFQASKVGADKTMLRKVGL